MRLKHAVAYLSRMSAAAIGATRRERGIPFTVANALKAAARKLYRGMGLTTRFLPLCCRIALIRGDRAWGVGATTDGFNVPCAFRARFAPGRCRVEALAFIPHTVLTPIRGNPYGDGIVVYSYSLTPRHIAERLPTRGVASTRVDAARAAASRALGRRADAARHYARRARRMTFELLGLPRPSFCGGMPPMAGPFFLRIPIDSRMESPKLEPPAYGALAVSAPELSRPPAGDAIRVHVDAGPSAPPFQVVVTRVEGDETVVRISPHPPRPPPPVLPPLPMPPPAPPAPTDALVPVVGGRRCRPDGALVTLLLMAVLFTAAVLCFVYGERERGRLRTVLTAMGLVFMIPVLLAFGAACVFGYDD